MNTEWPQKDCPKPLLPPGMKGIDGKNFMTSDDLQSMLKNARIASTTLQIPEKSAVTNQKPTPKHQRKQDTIALQQHK